MTVIGVLRKHNLRKLGLGKDGMKREAGFRNNTVGLTEADSEEVSGAK